MTREIPLNDGMAALVDDEDYDWLTQYRWFYDGVNRVAKTCVCGKVIPMHRLLLNAPKGMDVDHRDHNKLNNQRSNIRLATRQQNIFNRRKSRQGTSQYKGVSCDKKKTTKRWRAQIKVDGACYQLGYYDDEMDAALIYDMAARYHFGEYAYVNFDRSELFSAQEISMWYMQHGKRSKAPLIELLSIAYSCSEPYVASLGAAIELPTREEAYVTR